MIRSDLLAHVEFVSAGAAAQDFDLPVHPAGMIACYDRLTVIDYAAAPTLVTFGFKDGASEYLMQSFVPVVAGQVVTTIGRVFVASNFRPFVRVVGSGAGDRIGLFCFGYLSDKPY